MFMAMINNQQIRAVEEKKKILDPCHCLVDKHQCFHKPTLHSFNYAHIKTAIDISKRILMANVQVVVSPDNFSKSQCNCQFIM